MRGFLAVALLLASLAGCQDKSTLDTAVAMDGGVLQGVVVDAAVRPIAGADIQVLGTEYVATTDANGTFRFAGLLSGDYQVEAHKLGYADARQTIAVVAGAADPPFVRLQLVPDLTNAPYYEILKFDGYVEYGYSVSAGGSTLFSSSSTTAFAGNNDWRTFYAWDRIPDVVQGESWDPLESTCRHASLSIL